MKIIVKEPGKYPVYKNVENELHALQAIVGGYLEPITIDDNVIALCNEEGKFLNLPLNCYLISKYSISSVEGTIFFCGVDGEDFADVPDDFGIEEAEAVTCSWMMREESA